MDFFDSILVIFRDQNERGMRVYIFDKEYNLRANKNEDYLKGIAGYVERRVREIASSAPQKSKEEISILTCLNIADELHRERDKNKKAKQRIQQLVERVKKEVK